MYHSEPVYSFHCNYVVLNQAGLSVYLEPPQDGRGSVAGEIISSLNTHPSFKVWSVQYFFVFQSCATLVQPYKYIHDQG